MAKGRLSISIPMAAAVTFAAVYAMTPPSGGATSVAPSSPASSLATFTYYPNCNAAWSAGAAPIPVGAPGYRSELDGDSDGIACEPYHGY